MKFTETCDTFPDVMRRHARRTMWSALVFVLGGCGPFLNPVDPGSTAFQGTLSLRIERLTVSPTDQTYTLATPVELSAVALFEDGSSADVTDACEWVSTNPGVAAVSDNDPGLVTPLGTGTADVHAVYKGVSSSRFGSQAAFDLGLVCVSPAGSDLAGDGTRANPYRSIPHGIAQADLLGASSVLVADDLYLYGTPVVLRPGISLYGGYDPSTWQRNWDLFGTVVRNSQTTGGTYGSPNAAFAASDPAVTPSNTKIDGFLIQGGTGDHCAGIYLENGASPTIRKCEIWANVGTRSWGGIFAQNASPYVHENRIFGGGTNESYGIHNAGGADSIIFNNLIHGGYGTSRAEGINNHGSGTNPVIVNNEIYGGEANTAVNPVVGVNNNSGAAAVIWNNSVVAGLNDDAAGAVYGIVDHDSSSDIVNNIVYLTASAAGTRVGVFEETTTSDPLRLLNNVVSGDLTAYYVDEGSMPRGSSADMNDDTLTTQGGTATAVGNLGTDPAMIDTDVSGGLDLRLSGASPTPVSEGGLDLSADPRFPTYLGNPVDNNWTPRTVPWSIGAHEAD